MQTGNIIFDLGGVLLNIEYDKTVKAFKALGLAEPEKAFTKTVQAGVFQNFEKGLLSPADFIDALSKHMPGASPEQITDAWNALLGDFPTERYSFLKTLSKDFNLFVLSNTNAIHEKAFVNIIESAVGWANFESLFQGIAYSHELGMRKPEPEIFEEILKRFGLDKSETVFIDDTLMHVEAANKTGIKAFHLDGEEAEICLRRNLNLI